MKYLLRSIIFLGMAVSLITCYKMKLKNKCCDDSLIKRNIVDNDINFLLPNIITPNGDNMNEQFAYGAYRKDKVSTDPDYRPVFTVKQLKIYKINGSKVLFESNNYNL
jgi:hypothetical protein